MHMPRTQHRRSAWFFSTSATIPSVVISRPATDAAPWIAERTDFGRVDHAFGDEIAVFAGLRAYRSRRMLVLVRECADHDQTVRAGIDRDLARRRLDRLAHDLDAVLLVLVGLDALECLDSNTAG